MKKFCIIPAFNEEKKIETVVKGIRQYFDQVIVIDDGSSDETRQRAEKSGAKVLPHLINRGQGAALSTGMAFAQANQADLVVHFDADGQFQSEDIPIVMAPILNDEADIVFGSRFLEKKSELPWLKERIIFPIARLVNRLILDISLTDPQSGFRALGKKAIGMVSIEQDGAAHCSEILYKAAKSGLRIKEVPITVRYFDFGQSFFRGRGRGQGGFRIIKDLLIAKLIN